MITRSIFLTAFLVTLLTFAQSGAAETESPATRFLMSFVMTSEIIVSTPTADNTVLVYSNKANAWTSHRFPDNVKSFAVVSGATCAFRLKGDRIDEIAAIDANGKWQILKLPNPTNKTCEPNVTKSIAVFVIDDVVHAFSTELGLWDSVIAPGANPVLVGEMAVISSTDLVAAFSAKTGKWAVEPINTEGQ